MMPVEACICPCHREDSATCDDWDEPIDFGVGQCEVEIRGRDWFKGGYTQRQCMKKTRNMPRDCGRHRTRDRVR